MRGRRPHSLAAFVHVVTGSRTALGRGLDRAAVEDSGRRLGIPTLGEANHGSEVVDHRLEVAGIQPRSGLLVDLRLRREILGDVAPLGPGADEPAGAVEDVAKVMLTLASVLGQQAEVGQDELPFGDGGGPISLNLAFHLIAMGRTV